MKSPIHYMGNKFQLIEDLKENFPDKSECNTFIDLFGGSGCVSLNVDYDNIIYNELNTNMVELLNLFKIYTAEEIVGHIKGRIVEFGLPDESTDDRRKNKDLQKEKGKCYNNFRDFYNKSNKDKLDLYTLTFFSFCNLIRFNSKNEFNMPFGNQYFTNENIMDIALACDKFKKSNIILQNKNAFEVLSEITEERNELFVYLDPPYSNTTAIYNEQRAFGGWTIEDDNKLFAELDRISKLGVKWALSNVLENKGKTNEHIEQWAIKNGYKIIDLDRNYSALGKGNANSREVLILNYQPRFEQMTLDI